MLNSKEFVRELQLRHESAWMNPNVGSAETALAALPLTRADVDDAEARLERFAPFIKKVFPETAADRGLIESPLTEIENMRAWLNENEGAQLAGKLFLKRDSDLPVAGSVKARGGCYAVLKHTEDLALANRLVEMRDDYSVFATRAFRNFFSQYELHVGSTGNLGLSIGIMGAALGYRVTVHMSADARQWKKDLLRAKGVTVLEYGADYSYAVQKGRERATEDTKSYFIDDAQGTVRRAEHRGRRRAPAARLHSLRRRRRAGRYLLRLKAGVRRRGTRLLRRAGGGAVHAARPRQWLAE